MLSYSNQLEERVRKYCQHSPLAAPFYSKTDSNLSSIFYGHLEGLKEELRSLVTNTLPSSSSALSLPPLSHKASEVFRNHSLAHDWERLANALQTYRPDFPLALPKAAHERAKALANDFPTFPALPPVSISDFDLTTLWTHLALSFPSRDTSILVAIHGRFEALQEAVRAMTLREIFFSAVSNPELAELDGNETSQHRQSITLSQQALARRFEHILESVKAKGEEVRMRGHARASSVVKAARDAEESLYIAAVELAKGGQRLIRYEHLPTLWKNNEHILSGYRFIPKEQWGSLLRSTFEIHNETGNIMTHLVGAAIVAPLFWPSKEHFDEQTTPMDRMVQVIYLVAALKCLLLSVAWHVMAGCSDACLFERFACVDYTGIAWLVAASVWTLVYNQFYCQPNLAMVYSLSTLVVGLIGAIVPWASWFNDRKNKCLRILVFLTMCFTALAPFTHSSLAHGFLRTATFASPILPSLAAYVSGLIFYATQFPERLYPGRFDVVGHAHQFWHVSIVVAILLHYRATFYWHQERFNFSCSPQSTPPLLMNRLPVDINRADQTVHGWRILAGTLGDGLVGRIWDWGVDTLMNTF